MWKVQISSSRVQTKPLNTFQFLCRPQTTWNTIDTHGLQWQVSSSSTSFYFYYCVRHTYTHPPHHQPTFLSCFSDQISGTSTSLSLQKLQLLIMIKIINFYLHMKTVRKDGEDREDVDESNLDCCLPSVRLSETSGLPHGSQSLQSYCRQTRGGNINRDSLGELKQANKTMNRKRFGFEKNLLVFIIKPSKLAFRLFTNLFWKIFIYFLFVISIILFLVLFYFIEINKLLEPEKAFCTMFSWEIFMNNDDV